MQLSPQSGNDNADDIFFYITQQSFKYFTLSFSVQYFDHFFKKKQIV